MIGREFDHRLFAAVAPVSPDHLGSAIEELIEAQLLFRRGRPPDTTYVFKHALVQEAVYASLLKTKRQELHARVARALEELFPHLVAVRPETIAYHCTESRIV